MTSPIRGYNVAVTTVASGDLRSNEINIKGLSSVGIFCPTLASSCGMFLQVAPGLTSPTSASYVRLASIAPSSGVLAPWFWPVAGGSAAAILNLQDNPFTFARIELTVSQQALVTFTVTGK